MITRDDFIGETDKEEALNCINDFETNSLFFETYFSKKHRLNLIDNYLKSMITKMIGGV